MAGASGLPATGPNRIHADHPSLIPAFRRHLLQTNAPDLSPKAGAGGTPSPHHLLPVRCSLAPPHRPQVTSMAPWATLQCRNGHPPSSTGKGCHLTPAARGIFTTCSSDHVFPHETFQGPKSAAQLLRPCLGPLFRASASAMCPHRPVPTTPALSTSLPSCPSALSLPSDRLLIPKSHHRGRFICPTGSQDPILTFTSVPLSPVECLPLLLLRLSSVGLCLKSRL